MRSLHHVALLSFCVFLAACNHTATVDTTHSDEESVGSQETFKRYGIETAQVSYEMHGSQEGTEVLTFADWGTKEVKVTKSTVNISGITQDNDTTTIIDGLWIYNIDNTTKQGTKTEDQFTPTLLQQTGQEDLVGAGEMLLESMGGEKTGTDDVLGRTCDVWEIKALGSTTCVWNSIPLVTKVAIAGITIESVAVSIDESPDISDDFFALPSDVTFVDLPTGGVFENIQVNAKPAQ